MAFVTTMKNNIIKVCDPMIRTLAEAAYFVYAKKLKYFPDPGKMFALLTKPHQTAFAALSAKGYKLVDFANYPQGFCAVVFKRQIKRNNELIISIRGTNILSSADRKNDLQILFGKLPEQYKIAEDFAQDILSSYKPHLTHVTGHSLGGLLAQLVAVKFDVPAIVFESPGAKKFLSKLFGANFDPQKIKIINAMPNLINTFGEQVNPPLAIINNKGHKNFLSFVKQETIPSRHLHAHQMRRFLSEIDSDGNFRYVHLKKWPKTAVAFSRRFGSIWF